MLLALISEYSHHGNWKMLPTTAGFIALWLSRLKEVMEIMFLKQVKFKSVSYL